MVEKILHGDEALPRDLAGRRHHRLRLHAPARRAVRRPRRPRRRSTSSTRASPATRRTSPRWRASAKLEILRRRARRASATGWWTSRTACCRGSRQLPRLHAPRAAERGRRAARQLPGLPHLRARRRRPPAPSDAADRTASVGARGRARSPTSTRASGRRSRTCCCCAAARRARDRARAARAAAHRRVAAKGVEDTRSTATCGCSRSTRSAATRSRFGAVARRVPRGARARARTRTRCSPRRRTTPSAARTCARGCSCCPRCPTSGRACVERLVAAQRAATAPTIARPRDRVPPLPDAGRRLAALAPSARARTWRRRSREAKLHTPGRSPTRRTRRRSRLRARRARRSRVRRRPRAFVARDRRAAAVASLARTLLKLTAPGVPDIYQGTELWDLSLVDPDNRRPVDFERAARAARARAAASRPRRRWPSSSAGTPKLWLIWKALALRRRQPRARSQGPATGRCASTGAGRGARCRVRARRRARRRSCRASLRAPRPAAAARRSCYLPDGRLARRADRRTRDSATASGRGRLLARFPVALLRAHRVSAADRVWAPRRARRSRSWSTDGAAGGAPPTAAAGGTARSRCAIGTDYLRASTAARPRPTRARAGSRTACTARRASSTRRVRLDRRRLARAAAAPTR